MRPVCFLPLFLTAALSAAQETPKEPYERIPDSGRPPAAEVAVVHPLYRAYDQPPKLQPPGSPESFETRVQLTLAIRVDETGKAQEIQAVEAPLRGLAASASILAPRFSFEPAKKDGRPVRTWASLIYDLDIAMERANFATFTVRPIEKDDVVARVIKEYDADTWYLRYPKEIQPKDPATLSIEDVDFIPQPKKTSWKFDSTRLRSRFTALLQVSKEGSVVRVVPIGESIEWAILKWMRVVTAKWKVSPAIAGGVAVESWMFFDTAIEFDLTKAKERGQRSLQKNLKAVPEG